MTKKRWTTSTMKNCLGCAVRFDGRLAARQYVQGVLGYSAEWLPPDEERLVGQVRIFAHDGCGYPGGLERWGVLWAVLSCVKLVVSDLHVSLKAEEIRMLVMLRMNREFMEYMRASYPGNSRVSDTPLSSYPGFTWECLRHSIVGIQNSWYVCTLSWRCWHSWRRWGRWVGLWDEEKHLYIWKTDELTRTDFWWNSINLFVGSHGLVSLNFMNFTSFHLISRSLVKE